MTLKNFVLLAAGTVVALTGIMHHFAVKGAIPIMLPSFLLVQSQTDFVGDGQIAVSRAQLTAVRQDGSRVELVQGEDPRRPGSYVFSKKIIDFATGRQTYVNDVVQSTSTIALKDDGLYPFRVTPQAACAGTPDGQIVGYDVTKQYTEEYPDASTSGFGPAQHRIRETRWSAPALGCYLRIKEQFIDEKLINGVWTLEVESDTVTTQIRVGSVDSYFVIPATYKEMSYGQSNALRHQMFPLVYPAVSIDEQVRMDATYYNNRPQKY